MDYDRSKNLMRNHLGDIVDSEEFAHLFVDDLNIFYDCFKYTISRGFTHLHKCVLLTGTYNNLNDYLKEYLKIYIDNSHEKKAIPVLLTPIHRNSWENGLIKDTHGDYTAAMKELAKSMEVPLIDIHDKSRELFEKMTFPPVQFALVPQS